jgi:uncharacterized membrane protein
MGLAVTLHLLAVIFWVGGMSFAYFMLRPAAGPLEPPARLGLWNRVFGRFLPAVAVAILVILATGFYMWLGLGVRGPHVHAMAGLGIVMMLLFGHLWGGPFRRFRRAVAAGEVPVAAAQLNQIRIIVMINLALGVVVVVIASWGRYFVG